MKKFIDPKAIGAMILCCVMAITLCACKEAAPSSSEPENTSQISTTSSTEKETESSSESDMPSTSSVDTTKESTPKSSKPTSTTTKKITTTSKPTTATPTTTAPKKTPAQIIVGTWHGSVDVAPLFSQQGYEVEGVQMVSCEMEFTAGGVIYERIDRTSLKTVYTNLFTKLLNDTLTQNNLTKEQFETSIGKTCDQYLSELVQTAMDIVPQSFISAYKFEGDALYVREQNDADFEKEEYSFSGENKLTIVDSGVSVTYTRIG